MKVPDVNFWGMHAGRRGEADTLFLKENCVAIGWKGMGDLKSLAPDREAFKKRLAEAYPNKKQGAIPVEAGQLFRFIHEMKDNDFIVYPSKRDRQVHIGQVTGPYKHEPKDDAGYPHRRPVEWLRTAPRTNFSQGALHEIGSAMSLFLVKNYTDEFRAILEGVAPVAPPVIQDETIAAATEDVEDTTRDFVLKRLAQEFKGIAFEGFIVHLLECMGYHARLTRTNEPSVDIIAHKDHLGVEPPIIKVQVKSSEGVATDKDVSALYGKLSSDGQFGLFITLGIFSPASRNYEQGKSNLRLIDGDELVQLIFQYYDRFDSRHKGLLPLRRVYVPEPIETEDE